MNEKIKALFGTAIGGLLFYGAKKVIDQGRKIKYLDERLTDTKESRDIWAQKYEELFFKAHLLHESMPPGQNLDSWQESIDSYIQEDLRTQATEAVREFFDDDLK